MTSTHTSDIAGTVHGLRDTFRAGTTKPLAWRLRQLDALEQLVSSHEKEIAEALASDLGKPEAEAYLTETSFLLTEIRHTRRHLRRWAKARHVAHLQRSCLQQHQLLPNRWVWFLSWPRGITPSSYCWHQLLVRSLQATVWCCLPVRSHLRPLTSWPG